MTDKKTKLCCFIVPYFGKLPNTMPIFLKTAKKNGKYHWLLFTDDRTAYDYPENITVKYCEFADLVKWIREKYAFEIALPHPKKLCDFKPAYGHIFSEELKEYAFWGYCDLDEYFGDMEKFLPEEFLCQFDKIFTHGHMTIYRNTEEMRFLYQTRCETSPAEWRDYREVFAAAQNFVFDEIDMTRLANRGGGKKLLLLDESGRSPLQKPIFKRYLAS